MPTNLKHTDFKRKKGRRKLMEKHNRKAWLFLVAVAFLAVSCAPRQTQKTLAPFSAQDLSSKLRAGTLSQKTKSFLVVLDSSGSMGEKHKGQVKLDLARNFLGRMNQTIPEIELNGGLRRLGGTAHFASDSDLIYGIKPFTKPGLEGAIKTVALPVGETPLALAIKRASDDLKTAQGPIAAIIVSDGNGTEGNASKAAKGMKKRFGDRLCIYTVVIGNDPDGKEAMKEIAQEGRCGYAVDEKATRTKVAMANFVEKVFFVKVGDQDRDGVLDPSDECPNTPRGSRVDARGCPIPAQMAKAPKKIMDSDGDGVLDNADICPGTPRGAKVDSQGCWTLRNVKFDTSKWEIKPQFQPLLDEVVEVLEKNPSLTVQVQGHTDSRGTAKYNQRLSENRANAVTKYLTKKGIPKQRLNPMGLGLTNPVASNKTPAGRARNRRVQFKPNK
jgi:OOP family OmpA-OmpF porin